MSPEGIKGLRQELGCTARELATALGIEQDTVLSWERGDLFPTKRFVDMMEALRRKGPGAIPKKKRGAAARAATEASGPFQVLGSPDVWRLVRKIVAHAELRAEVAKLAETYSDPLDEPGTPEG
jgi:transcriptional regulator with XRE-family HTH domain